MAIGFENANTAVKMHHTRSLGLYKALVDAGVCREQARGVLPQNLYTQYFGTVNLHNLLKFVSLRIHEGAQWEIQRGCKGMFKNCQRALSKNSVNSFQKK